ncbi:M4 family metallopeptidase [Methylobacterium oryzisoli]|uniref:M4 family metallopeptidase n=1 Tax=Methylobacterium oryzisoli TaxID=3385502 RepID=UPI0038922DCE
MPPHILKRLLESESEDVRKAAMATLMSTERLRGQRSLRAMIGVGVAPAPTKGRRSIFDCKGSVNLRSARLVRTEQGPASKDPSVNHAFDGLGTTRDFYQKVFNRNSIDGKGMRLDGYVHRGMYYNNAFWDGQEMVFGDGDGILFSDFTGSLDVIAHELTHGVTEHTAGMEYHNQSGALNESMSDVFGSLVKQWKLRQSADEADWLIGAEIFTPALKGDALRSVKAPGSAYDNAELGKDPQPDHMSKYARLPDTEDGDFGGVHINSGIPNRAFYLAATNIGGNAWEAPGLIWYESLRASDATTDFQEFADTTAAKAGQLYGANSKEREAVTDAWGDVGIRVTSPSAARARALGETVEQGRDRDADPLAALMRHIETLSVQVDALAQEVSAIRGASLNGPATSDIHPAASGDGSRRSGRASAYRKELA